MILMFLLDLVDLGHLLDFLDRHVRLDHRQDALQLHHLLVMEEEWEPEIIRVSGYLCDLHYTRLNLFQFR